MHAPALFAHARAWHLGMDDSPTCGHPLNVAGRQLAAIAGGVFVLEFAVEQVRDGLESAMRVIGRADRLAGRVVDRTHFIEQEEGIEQRPFRRWKGSPDDKATTFDGPTGLDQAYGLANRHVRLSASNGKITRTWLRTADFAMPLVLLQRLGQNRGPAGV